MNTVEEQVEAFIAFKQGLGISMVSDIYTLRRLIRYAKEISHEGPITLELALSWAQNDKSAAGYAIKKYEMARRISEYSSVFDESTPRLPAGLLGKTNDRITPYIYTDEEVSLLMRAASKYYSQQDPLRPIAYEVLIGLLRATGMRPFEALCLEDRDFDQGNSLLMVRKAKNNKERMLPIDQSTCNALSFYQEMRDSLRTGSTCKNLIIANGDMPLGLSSFQIAFYELRCILLDRGEVWQRRPPRPYDLRHSFAVRTLLSWHESKADINALLPALATYMGHANVSETYWYLTGTPELMEVACSAFEGLAKAGDRSWQQASVSKA
jgi:integrase